VVVGCIAPPPASAAPVQPALPNQPSCALPVYVHGLDRTRLDTVLELLPRAPPAIYTDAELVELERRLANLGIFDLNEVKRGEAAIDVTVREKWTLIPVVDFATGTSWKDTYALAGMTEYNFLGRGMQLQASVWHAERGWNGAVGILEHSYHPARGAFGARAEYGSSNVVFEDSDDAWGRQSGGFDFQWQAPHGEAWSYYLGATYNYERSFDAETRYKPPNGNHFIGSLLVTWESLHWDDLAPSGFYLKLNLLPGIFVTSHTPEPRMMVKAYAFYSLAFTDTTALMAQLTGTGSNRGNANFSTLLGSYGGVRGLEDAIYHTWLQGVLTVELRQAIRFAERWALQFVAFGDGAAFEQIDSRGRRADFEWAASAGVGVRVIPTFLADVTLRFDVARTFWPDQRFFWQWGLSQYF
jgi:outer membrane protein assembly factor BamA